LLLLALSAALAAPASALDTLVEPVLPSLAARGGAGAVTSTGYEAFFANPAGFRTESAEVTVLSLNPWLEGGLEWGQGVEDALLDRAADGGVSIGGSVGVGYAGRGLGLGLLFTGGARVQGEAALYGEAAFQLGLTAGYSYGFDVLGLSVAVGTSLRPLLRAEVALDDEASRDVIHASAVGGLPLFEALWLEQARYAVGLAVDLGVLAKAGPLQVGALLTDVGGTTFRYSSARFGDLVADVASLRGTPEGGSTDESHTVPMQLRLGAAYSILPALTFHLEITDPFLVMQGEADLDDNIHAGLELAPREGLGLWLGLEGASAAAGARWRLGPLDTSFAVHGLDLRGDGGSKMGIAAETAIRF
jgi:hypothetical protein